MRVNDLSYACFTCFRCHGVFRKGWSDAEAKAESDARMTNAPIGCDFGEIAQLCDHCNDEFLAWAHATGVMKDGIFASFPDTASA